MSLSPRAAIIGVAESDLGRTPDKTVLQLQAQAARAALDDAGLAFSDIDALFCAGNWAWSPGLMLAEYLGLRPRYTDTTNIGGSSFEVHIEHAVAGIEAGLFNVALITYGSIQRSDRSRNRGNVSFKLTEQYEPPFGLPTQVGAYALAAMRHMFEYGTTSEQLAEVAVALPPFENLAHIIRTARHPVVLASNTCIDLPKVARIAVERTGLHISAELEHGIRALSRFLWWSEQLRTAPEKANEEILPLGAHDASVGVWSEVRARALLQQAGIPTVPGQLVTSADEAVRAARELGLPVVLKIQSAALLHKSDIGGVALDLRSEEAVYAEFTAMLERVRESAPDAEIEGILVCPLRPAGTELLVGVVRDPVWGLVLTVGLGGIWTEVLKDTAIRVLPVGRAAIEMMLGELRGAELLLGARGQRRVDLQALSAVIERIGALALSLGPRLSVLEINPLLVDATRIEALDVLVQQ